MSLDTNPGLSDSRVPAPSHHDLSSTWSNSSPHLSQAPGEDVQYPLWLNYYILPPMASEEAWSPKKTIESHVVATVESGCFSQLSAHPYYNKAKSQEFQRQCEQVICSLGPILLCSARVTFLDFLGETLSLQVYSLTLILIYSYVDLDKLYKPSKPLGFVSLFGFVYLFVFECKTSY